MQPIAIYLGDVKTFHWTSRAPFFFFICNMAPIARTTSVQLTMRTQHHAFPAPVTFSEAEARFRADETTLVCDSITIQLQNEEGPLFDVILLCGERFIETNFEDSQATGRIARAPDILLVSPVGGPHSLRGVGRGDGGGREQWRREKNAQVSPMVEAKRGGGREGSGVDSGSTRHAKKHL
jgi:hypothetical protein